jgi:hypothetical protein
LVEGLAESGVAGQGEDTVLPWLAAEELLFAEFELVEIPSGIRADREVGNDVYAVAVTGTTIWIEISEASLSAGTTCWIDVTILCTACYRRVCWT